MNSLVSTLLSHFIRLVALEKVHRCSFYTYCGLGREREKVMAQAVSVKNDHVFISRKEIMKIE